MADINIRTFWEERLAANYSLAGVGHMNMGLGFNRWMYEVRRHVVTRMIPRHVTNIARSRVLDVGSGTGFYLELWRSLGCKDLSGCDLTQVAVDHLRQSQPSVRVERWAAGDAQACPFDGPFHAISCFDVLFHIVDDEKLQHALRQFHDLLAPGGALIISDNFLHRPSGHVAHFRSRTLAEYERLLAATGFQVLERRPMFVLMNTPVDSRFPPLHRFWNWLERRCLKDPGVGDRWGRRLQWLEKRLVNWLHEGPSTEIMVCRRT